MSQNSIIMIGQRCYEEARLIRNVRHLDWMAKEGGTRRQQSSAARTNMVHSMKAYSERFPKPCTALCICVERGSDSNAAVLKLSSTQIQQCSNSAVLKFSSTRIQQYSNSAVLNFSSTQILQYSNVQYSKLAKKKTEPDKWQRQTNKTTAYEL